MKYTGEKIANGKGNTVWTFFIGKEELQILHDVLSHYAKSIPDMIGTQILLARINTMKKEVHSVLLRDKTRKAT